MEEGKIKTAKYTKKYKEIKRKLDIPRYLTKESIDRITKGDEVRVLLKIRCGNMEEANKYWLRDEYKLCVFCKKGQDCIDHYVKECNRVREWFKPLGENVSKRIHRIWSDELDDVKGKIIKRLWKEKGRKDTIRNEHVQRENAKDYAERKVTEKG